ncbi:MAG: prepilin-type N-terminal cleavage/methylation domain-containing protein [Candidatus Omnitrophota bacterium]|nr:MAG: prepilin-type N-terminal cleavage/methylation domain-containing protein [Candidatus Omnitrophota bacterium]
MKRRAGLTLVEVMVVIFTFAVVLGAIYGVLTAGRQSWFTNTAEVELQQEVRRAMDWMSRELRRSGSSQVNIAPDGSLTLQVAINDNPDWGAEGNAGWYIKYSLSNGEVLREVFDGADVEQVNLERALTNNVSALSFTAVSASEIRIDITAQKDILQGRTIQSSLNFQVTLRN